MDVVGGGGGGGGWGAYIHYNFIGNINNNKYINYPNRKSAKRDRKNPCDAPLSKLYNYINITLTVKLFTTF